MTTPNIFDVLDLDHDEWMIVGLAIGGGEHGLDPRVMAVHRDQIGSSTSWVAVDIAANNNGEIPVNEFLVHDVDPYEVLKAIVHMFDLRLRVSSFNQFPIRVVEQGDIREQPS